MIPGPVVPLVGAWIEMINTLTSGRKSKSFPSWERGLKCFHDDPGNGRSRVVPLVGAWIEIWKATKRAGSCPSLPSGERGLK